MNIITFQTYLFWEEYNLFYHMKEAMKIFNISIDTFPLIFSFVMLAFPLLPV